MEGNRTTWDRGAYEFGSGGSGSLTVSAGSALTVMLPNSATLNGSYANPLGGIVTLGWSVVSGPGTVSFSSPASATTTASFSAAGTYVLRLTATVAAVSASDDVTVTVTQPDTTPPTVSVTLPAANAVVSNSVTLAANATDNAGGAGVTNVTFLVDGTVVGSDSSAPYTASWNSLTMPNGQHSIQARAKDGAGNQTTSAFISVTVQNPVAPAGTVRIEAENGSISGDFTVSNGAVSQTTDTTVTTGGRAVYSFTVTNAGDYQIDAVVNAPDLAENSFFVNIDAEPVDPNMVWDILPLTTGFETRTISWRGNGSAEVQAPNKVFTLSAGQHSLIIIGREANTSLDRLEIKKIVQPLAPPSNIRVVVTP
jgi:hypothetical protein